jgi:hypothetical protein
VSLLNYPVTALPLFVQSPINIVRQDGATVTFNISNPFGEKMQAMYYQYYEGTNVKCLEKAKLGACIKPLTVTASCRAGHDSQHKQTLKFTTVEFWFVDQIVIKAEDQADIAECCHPEAKHADINTAVFSYKVYCETSCPLTEAARSLRSPLN